MIKENIVSEEVIEVLASESINISKIRNVKRVENRRAPILAIFQELGLRRSNVLFFIGSLKKPSGEIIKNILIKEGKGETYSITSSGEPLVDGTGLLVSFVESSLFGGFCLETSSTSKEFFSIPQYSQILRFRLSKSEVLVKV
ncbi:MAG: hypothetical protein PF542_05440 [Nanoarchaeota archaeon]|jgi:hypothetical protein|nr:hypothetical protein [Nanoarchaeota archaeon]